MTSQVDPLLLLQHTLSSRQTITLLDPSGNEVYDLGDASTLSLPSNNPSDPESRINLLKTSPTRWRKPGVSSESVSPDTNPQDFFDVATLLFCFLSKDKGPGEYVAESQKLGLGFVSTIERKKVEEYLAGRGDGGDSIVLLPDKDPSLASSAVPSAHPTSLDPNSQRPTKRARYIVNREDLEAVKKLMASQESKQLMDRTTVLRCSKGGRVNNFEVARSLVADRLKLAREEIKRFGSGQAAMANAARMPDTPSKSNKRRIFNPIIIISPSSSSLLTMYNVKHFLEDAVFEPSDFVRRRLNNAPPEPLVTVHHKRAVGIPGSAEAQLTGSQARNGAAATGEKTTVYHVFDTMEGLTQRHGTDAWDRVVCVVTTGQEWQFRDYKWSEPKVLFHNVKGICLQLTTDPPIPKVKEWNVEELKIDPVKRHIDKSTVANFWRTLEAWIQAHKPHVDF